MNKKILMLLLVLICAVSLSAVSADDSVVAASADTVVLSEDSEVTHASDSFHNLQEVINANNTLNQSYTNNATNHKAINITTNKTIDGQGNFIDANNTSGIFNISAHNVTIKNLTFKNANGTAINFNGVNLTLINCIFENNLGNGAIIFNGTLLKLINCTFTNNQNTQGGAINAVNGTVIVQDSVFTNNTAKTMGGAIYANKSLTVIGSTFEGNAINASKVYGAAIRFLAGNLTVVNSTFVNNGANNTNASRIEGAAICFDKGNLNITGSTFTGNGAHALFNHTNSSIYGGAVRADSGNVVITNSNFTDNAAYSSFNNIANSAVIVGGAVRSYSGNVTIINTTFTGNGAHSSFNNVSNQSHVYGGAVCFDKGNLTIDGSNFVDNNAYSSFMNTNHSGVYGAIRFMNGNLTVSDSTFTGNGAHSSFNGVNSSNVEGAAIRVDGGKVNVTETTFDNNGGQTSFNNTNSSSVYGGALMTGAGNLTVKDSTFTSNGADSSNVNGGAIWFLSGNSTFDNTSFTNNAANSTNVNGGAIRAWTANLTATDSKFDNNSATNGGAIYINNNKSNLNINNTTFTNNKAENGSAVFFKAADLTVNNAVFNNNNATANGGAIYVSNATATKVDNSTFENNFAANEGGAIYIKNGTSLAINNTAFKANVAQNNTDDVKVVNASTVLKLDNITSDKNAIKKNDTLVTANVTFVTSITINNISDVNPSTNITISGTVSPNATGKVNITLSNGTSFVGNVSNGTFNVTIGVLAAGNYTATVKFNGTNYTDSNATVSFVVVKVPTVIDIELEQVMNYTKTNITLVGNVTVNGNKTNATNGANITITITDVAKNTTTNLTAELINGTFNVTGPVLDAGQYVITAVYNGTELYDASSITKDLSIISPTTTTINTTANITIGNELPVDITVVDSEGNNVSGNVTVFVDGTEYSNETLVNGTVSLNITGLTAGNHTITVVYPGDSIFTASNATATVFVISPELSVPDVTLYFKNGTALVITLTQLGEPLANETVSITINNRTYTRVTDENGTASLAINLAPGVYPVLVTYEANETISANATVTVLPTMQSQNIVKYFKNGTQYEVTVLDAQGNPAANQTVELNVHGVIYVKTTDANGTARLNINLAPGEYIITATAANGAAISSNITVLPTIAADDIKLYFRNGTRYEVTVLDGQGNPAANKTVSLNINGVFYNKTTDENGTASLGINLNAGNYTITADCDGAVCSSNIEVLPILEAENLEKTVSESAAFEVTALGNHGELVANATIVFNINGVFYNKTTDDDGIARLNITLAEGEYIITSTYNDFNISNKVTVTKD